MINTIKKQENGKIILTIEVPFEDYKKYIEHAAEHISEHVEVKGFRPGKAPYNMVAAKVGEMAIYEEALQFIVESSYYEALQTQDIKEKVFHEPEIKIEKLAPGNPIIFIAELMLVPEIKLGKYKDLKIKKEKQDTNSKEFKDKVEKTIEELRRMRSVEVAKNDGVIADGDKADIDLDLFINGVPLENGSYKNFKEEVRVERFIPGYYEQIIGLKVGDKKEFELTFPEDYFEKTLANKKVLFKIVVNAINKVELPEFNDDFAKTLKFDTLEAFKKQLEENIIHEDAHKDEEKLSVKMLEAIEKDSKISELPARLVLMETKKMVNELKGNIEQNGMDFENYKTSIKKTEEELQEEFKTKAEERLKISLIIEKIAEEEKIDVTDEELNKELEAAKIHYNSHPDFENIKQNLEHPEYQAQVKRVLKNEKVVKFLKEKNIIE